MRKFINRFRITLLGLSVLSTVMAQRSLDEMERDSFAARFSLAAMEGVPMNHIDKFPSHSIPQRTVSLDGEWTMVEGGNEKDRLDNVWQAAVIAEIPGSVHSALWKSGLIPDPYVERNDTIAEKQSYKTWWFKKEFSLTDTYYNPILSFGGIANRCTVWLNGKKLGAHEGMFGGPDFEIKKQLKDHNTLIVRLDPIPEMYLGGWPATANESWKYTVVFNCVYGWHYAKIPSLGIWRSVEIQDYVDVKLEAPFITTKSLEGDMKLNVTISQFTSPIKGELYAEITPANFSGETQLFKLDVNSAKKEELISANFKIENPQLWWPNDRGAQPLYNLELTFVPQKGKPEKVSSRFGIRTIEMAPFPEGPQEDKYNWTFVVNGKPMFVKGTGWCTMDPLMDFSREKYDHLLKIAKLQHIQLLRAWGGGMPETDDFYELCDEYGIMVIQEWPTAWNSHTTQPYEMLKETVERNTIRLRNHPSLVMWGAGNESDQPFGKAIDMMGRLSLELDGSRPFHRGEAWGGSTHDYTCWWDDAHLNHNLTMTSPFWGEFGIASLPHVETVKKYLGNEQQHWPPEENGHFIHHTPIFGTNGEMRKLKQYAGYFMPDDTLEEMITGSQLSQVEGVRHTLERARTLWPATTGALYYKMNDNYPALSWSCVDFYGVIKPVHYFVQRSFAPLAAVLLFDQTNLASQEVTLPLYILDDCNQFADEEIEVKVSVWNDRLEQIETFSFIKNGLKETVTKAGDISLTKEQTTSTLLFFVVDLIKEEECIYRNYYFTNYETRRGVLMEMARTNVEVSQADNQVLLKNKGELPAIGVHIESPGNMDKLILSENYLWINPGETKIIEINTALPVIVKGWNLE